MKSNTSNGNPSNSAHAFTRLELLVVLGSIALLVGLSLPALAYTRPKSELIVCANNLRQISNSWRSWAGEHGDRWPWQLTVASGGSQNQPEAWYHFLVVSNELRTPSILACPGDFRKPALHFMTSANGLPGPTNRNRAVSYFIGLDSLPIAPTTILTGDRHFSGSSAPTVNCSRMPSAGAIAYELNRTDAASGRLSWTNPIHGSDAGNAATADGSVTMQTSVGFREMVLRSQGDGNFNNHILPPY